MNFWNFITAIVVRTKERDARDVWIISSFVRSWTKLASLGNNVVDIGTDRTKWVARLESAYPSTHLKQTLLILKKSRGGLGARDFFDACHVMIRNARNYNNGEFVLFEACSCIRTTVACTIGGMYGDGLVRAITMGLTNICPEVLSTHETTDRFLEFKTRLMGSLEDDIHAYARQICIGLRKEKNTLCAGIINHFSNTYHLNYPVVMSATEQDVVSFLMKYKERARAYLKECNGPNVPIDVKIDDDVSCVSLSLRSGVKGQQQHSVNDVVRSVNIGAPTIEETDTVVDVLGKGFARAEWLWENGKRIL